LSMASLAMEFTQLSEIPTIVSSTRSSFLSGLTLSESFRKRQLAQLYKLIDENTDDIICAVRADMQRRPASEIALTEISCVRSEIAHQMNHLSEYMAPKKVTSSAAFLTDSGHLHPTPKGNVLLISPWNFPFQLTFSPLAGAIAAGCTAVIKPSEVSLHCGRLMARLIGSYLDQRCYRVVLGGPKETTLLLSHRFDLIFFTGGCSIGKMVAKAAAEHLTPCVLELGGKNPVVLDDSADFEMAARRIAWGRWCVNAGQVCLAPEYVIVNRHSQQKLIAALRKALTEFFGRNPQMHADYAGIINARHFARLSAVLAQNKAHIAVGGEVDASDNFVAPTILSNVTMESAVMREEVFGPILSVVPVGDVRTEAIALIQSGEKPLALYVFTSDKGFAESVVRHTDSGGVTVNDVISHFMFAGFPFGGAGMSGQGRYHGKYSFEAFSHDKPVLYKYAGGRTTYDLRLPPFTDWKGKVFRMFTEEKPHSWKLPFSVSPVTAGALAAGAFFLKSRL